MDERALYRINDLDEAAAIAFFTTFCGAERWARRMASSRPIRRVADLMEAADQAFEGMRPADWLEAFNHHPRIGDVDGATELDGGDGCSVDEQAQVRIGAQETLDTLTEENKKYEETFGYIFIVCAAGKSADQILSLLRTRLHHSPEEELRIAAQEQVRITQLRLERGNLI